VGADQAVAVAVAELDGNVFEQRLGAELHGDVCGRDQGQYPRGFQREWLSDGAILVPVCYPFAAGSQKKRTPPERGSVRQYTRCMAPRGRRWPWAGRTATPRHRAAPAR